MPQKNYPAGLEPAPSPQSLHLPTGAAQAPHPPQGPSAQISPQQGAGPAAAPLVNEIYRVATQGEDSLPKVPPEQNTPPKRKALKVLIWVAVVALVIFLTLFITALIAGFTGIPQMMEFIFSQLGMVLTPLGPLYT